MTPHINLKKIFNFPKPKSTYDRVLKNLKSWEIILKCRTNLIYFFFIKGYILFKIYLKWNIGLVTILKFGCFLVITAGCFVKMSLKILAIYSFFFIFINDYIFLWMLNNENLFIFSFDCYFQRSLISSVSFLRTHGCFRVSHKE